MNSWLSGVKPYLVHGADLLPDARHNGEILGEEAGEHTHHAPSLHLKHVVYALQVASALAAHHRAHNVLTREK
jgi:hypothetical protein